jgi:flagellar M-ring protein FliF
MAAKNPIAVTKQAPSGGQVLERAKAYWAGLRPQQQVYLGVGLAVTLAVAAFFVKMIATPDYKPLMKGLESADAQAMSAQLTAKKIPNIISPDGTSISVPADQVDAARLEVASQDAPHSGRIGFEIFDKVSWGQTEFDEKVNYQRALEGELERTIQVIGNVKSARVHIVMATDSVFMDRERGAKASVILRLKHGTLSREELAAISRLVSGAVDELKPEDVAIVDADSNQLLGRSGSAGDEGDGIDQELTRRLISTLGPIVGADRMRATVNVEYETGSSEESQEKYDPAVSAALSTQHTEENTGPGSAIGGVPGTSSNVPTAKASAVAATSKEMSQSSKTDTYGVNKTTRHIIEPAGGIRRISAAVVLDDAIERKQINGKWVEVARKRQPEELKYISDLAQAAIGFNSARGDQISVQNLTFDRAIPIDTEPPTFAEKARKGVDDFSSIIRYGVLLVLFFLVYMLMIRPIQRRVLAPPTPLLASSQAAPRAPSEPVAATPEFAATLAQRSLALKKQLSDFVLAEPEHSTTAVRTWLREEAQ